MRRDIELDQVYYVADRVDVHCLYQVQFFFISETGRCVSLRVTQNFQFLFECQVCQPPNHRPSQVETCVLQLEWVYYVANEIYMLIHIPRP